MGGADAGAPAGRAAESAPAAAATNHPPVVVGVVIEPLGLVTVEHDVRARARAYDVDGDDVELSYSWWVNGASAPAGDVLTRDHFQRGDQIELEVVASDGHVQGAPLRSQPFEVANAAPHFVSQPEGFDSDGTFHYQLGADDPDGDDGLHYRLLESPAGMTLGGDGSVLTWRPRHDQTGSHRVVVEVADAKGATATQSFELRVPGPS